jgi:hypothetical protein
VRRPGQFFVLRHGFKLGRNRHPWLYALVGGGVVLAAIVWLRPGMSGTEDAICSVATNPMDTRAIVSIDYETVRLDSLRAVAQHAQAIYQQAVMVQTMPINNAIHITPQERALLKTWYEEGAKTQ